MDDIWAVLFRAIARQMRFTGVAILTYGLLLHYARFPPFLADNTRRFYAIYILEVIA